MDDANHKINELRQEKKFLDKINTAFSDELEKTKKDNFELEKENINLKKDLNDIYHKTQERKQEKLLVSKSAQDEKEKKSNSPIMCYLTMAGGFIMRGWNFIQQVV